MSLFEKCENSNGESLLYFERTNLQTDRRRKYRGGYDCWNIRHIHVDLGLVILDKIEKHGYQSISLQKVSWIQDQSGVAGGYPGFKLYTSEKQYLALSNVLKIPIQWWFNPVSYTHARFLHIVSSLYTQNDIQTFQKYLHGDTLRWFAI